MTWSLVLSFFWQMYLEFHFRKTNIIKENMLLFTLVPCYLEHKQATDIDKTWLENN